jgi:hypothetical protein
VATAAYLTGRKRYQRPQGILWSENPGTLQNGLYVPTGFEVGAELVGEIPELEVDQFLILSDHNRGEMQFNPTRIEQRQRTINGRMRSYHIADKLAMSVSWNNLPSRSYSTDPSFNSSGITNLTGPSEEFTSDGGAGGSELLDWYDNHKGPFYMFLAYDKYSNFPVDGSITGASYTHLAEYNQVIQVFISDFSYSVVKRGGSNHDLWNVSVTMEEV